MHKTHRLALEHVRHFYWGLGLKKNWRASIYLRFGVACCFIGHGLLAYHASSNFGSEWSAWVRSIFPESLQYTASVIFLKIVAMLDVSCGLLALRPKIPRIALIWLLGWGSLTAFARLFFLEALRPPIEINTLNAFAEFFKRAPNWIFPLLLIALTSPIIERTFRIIHKRTNWLNAAVGGQILGIYLKNCSQVSNPHFEFELSKSGLPIWSFWTVTASSFLGLIIVIIAAKAPNYFTKIRLLSFIVPLTYLASEGVEIYIHNLPRGLSWTMVSMISHGSMYLSMLCWTLSHLRWSTYKVSTDTRLKLKKNA